MQDFYNGTSFEVYKYLGAHLLSKGQGCVFRTYAPNAVKAAVVADCNEFQEIFMENVDGKDIYETVVPDAVEGTRYKYRIYKNEKEYSDHCDPYGFGMEVSPGNCSVVYDLETYEFQDEAWIAGRGEIKKKPFHIYEVHLGSFYRKESGGWYTYEEIAQELVRYVKQEGYNYIEFMPYAEYPLDASWGYQSMGSFAPAARYGSPAGLKKLVDTCHKNGIGVIMDCMMAYFVHLNGEVRSFLQSMTNYWLEEYHFDGLRFGNISRFIYWQGDKHSGVNGSAVDFLKCMNLGVRKRFPNCILITENIAGFPKVTQEISKSGLGYDFQWDSNWVQDILKYMSYSPQVRKKQYYILPFSMIYFYEENFMLAFSHDELVRRQMGIFPGIYGETEQKLAQVKAMYMYMYAHPGKLLNFMGNECAQSQGWNGKDALPWEAQEKEEGRKLQHFVKELNELYQKEPALYEKDYEEAGFDWLDCEKNGNCIYAFRRTGDSEIIYSVYNFDEEPVKDYILNVGETENVKVIFSSDWESFGGGTAQEIKMITAKKKAGGNQIILDIPAYTAMYLKQ